MWIRVFHSPAVFLHFHAPCVFSCALRPSRSPCVFYGLLLILLFHAPHASQSACVFYCPSAFLFSTVRTCMWFLVLRMHHNLPVFLAFRTPHVFSCSPCLSRSARILYGLAIFLLFHVLCMFSCTARASRSVHISSFPHSAHIFLHSMCIAGRPYFLWSTHISSFPSSACVFLRSAPITVPLYFLFSMLSPLVGQKNLQVEPLREWSSGYKLMNPIGKSLIKFQICYNP